MSSSVWFEHRISIPHVPLAGGGINADQCVCLPDDPITWKKRLEDALDGNGEIFLVITNLVGGDYTLTFGDSVASNIEGPPLSPEVGIRDFSIVVSRETLRSIYAAIKFALQQK